MFRSEFYLQRIIDAHRQGKPEAMGFDEEEIQVKMRHDHSRNVILAL